MFEKWLGISLQGGNFLYHSVGLYVEEPPLELHSRLSLPPNSLLLPGKRVPLIWLVKSRGWSFLSQCLLGFAWLQTTCIQLCSLQWGDVSPPPPESPMVFPHCLTGGKVLPNSGGNYWKSHCCEILKPHHPIALMVINLPFKEEKDQHFSYANIKWRRTDLAAGKRLWDFSWLNITSSYR